MENREIDRLVAEKVMGWVISGTGEDEHVMVDRNTWMYLSDFAPSTSIQHAWVVVENLDYDVKVTKYKNSGYQCHVFIPSNVQMVFAESAPMAICKAALKAVGVKVQSMKEHVLYTKEDFKDMSFEELENNRTAELVLDSGLDICKKCGEFEAGLDNPCHPRKE